MSKDQKQFKKLYRKDACSSCPKREPCALMDGICDLITPCQVCEIRDICTSLCDQMKAYLARGNRKPVSTVSFDVNENLYSHKAYLDTLEENIRHQIKTMEDIPWQAISERDRAIVMDHFVHDRTYQDIAEKYKLSLSHVHSIIHGKGRKGRGALAILDEYCRFRELLRDFGQYVPKRERELLTLFYQKCIMVDRIARLKGKSISTIYRNLHRARRMLQRFENAQPLDEFGQGETDEKSGSSS